MELKKKKKVHKMFIDEEDETSGVFAISLVADPAIESNWIYLNKQHKVELKKTDKIILIKCFLFNLKCKCILSN